MFRRMFILFIVLVSLQSLFAQTETKFVGKLKYEKNNDGWFKNDNNKKWKVVEDQIVVKKKVGVDLKKINLKKYGLDDLVIEEHNLVGGYCLVKLSKNKSFFEVSELLLNTDLFDFVEPNLLGEYTSVNPNDQFFTNQWNLSRINIPQAWDISKGSTSIKVAVIDCGAHYNHPDLSGNLDGQIGWNFYYNNNDPVPHSLELSHRYHGTMCAGIISASTNNNIGVSGIAGGWNGNGVKLLHYNVDYYESPQPNSYYVAQAITRAVENGAKVISLSLVCADPGGLIAAQINNAVSSINNRTIIAATGNYIKPTDGSGYVFRDVNFPASHQNVIAVGAITQSNLRKIWDTEGDDGSNEGNWGSCYRLQQTRQPDLVAPGINVPTTDLLGSLGKDASDYYQDFNGTSAATPIVSSVAALILSINPTLSPSTVKTILTSTTNYYSIFMNANEYGNGIVDAYKALKYTIEHYGGTFNQNVTLPAGDTWNLQPGVTLTFASGCALIVNGTLNAVGNTSNPITFTRSGTSGTWNGIQFNSGSSGTVQYCTITYATDGVYCYNASPQIKYNTIQNCSNGVYLNYYSSPTIAGNTIKENTSTGVSCWNYSSPTFNDGYGDGNVVRNNSSYGVQARYNSNPNLNKGYYGYGNSVKNNTYNELIAEFNCTVTARNVWWGNNPPLDSQFYLYGGSTLDRANPLTSDPYPSRNVIAQNADYQASVNTLSKIVSSIGDDNLNLALDKQKDKKYDEAIPLFLEVFKNNKDALLGKYALSKIEECYTQAGKKDYLDYSKKEIKPLLKDGSETYVEALELEAHQMVNLGLYKEAVNNLETILKKYNLNGEIEKNTLFTLGAFHNIFFGDKVNSDKYFEELKQKYPKDDLVNQIEIVKGFGLAANGSVQSANASTPLIETTPVVTATVSEDAIINYPNPFNPSTRISFTLKDGGKVSLKVYDVLGKEVANLADGVYEVGKHTATFDGSNLASGIYFYRLVTPNATITKKMMLMK